MVVAFLLDRKGANINITEELVQAALRNPTCSAELINTLLDRKKAPFRITEGIVRAAHYEDIKILLNRGAKVKITKEIVIASKGNRSWLSPDASEDTTKALIDQKDLNKFITEQGFLEVFRQCSADVVELLLNRTGSYSQITDDLLEAASSNLDGCRILQLLLKCTGSCPPITDELLKAASSNFYGHAIVQLLLDRGANVEITERGLLDILTHSSGSVLTLLIVTGRLNLIITKEVINAVAESFYALPIMEGLLDQKGVDMTVTDEFFTAASKNPSQGGKVMKLLIERKGADIHITEEAIRAVANHPASGEAAIKHLFYGRGINLMNDEELKLIQKISIFPPRAEAVIKFLHDLRGTNIVITKEMILHVAQFPASGEELRRS
ncbi:uncharacterized protein N7483_008008 [Penicillium malachiteum]|uniref:uncharacterized protein n=1 Tax=Penicillium malachiteum TaxID=1324776 RepID=UPI0025492A8E|nr:uncharacterized protein N7483_008008 [Penicillium malachiteum]KAJ5726651.1 hypothetical protein N7483_008008 [Penicillium malachiteum]